MAPRKPYRPIIIRYILMDMTVRRGSHGSRPAENRRIDVIALLKAAIGGFIAVALVVAGHGAAVAQGKPVLVFAAASLKTALDDIAEHWQSEAHKKATISYAASSALAKQIEQGAPADLFLSADLDWMDYLAARDLIKPETRVNLLGSRIVLVAPRDVSIRVLGLDFTEALGDGKLAMANVDAVPAGKYGKAALESLGLWPKVKDKVVQTDNVRAALVLVARGEARLGIVYQTDAEAEPGVRIVTLFPEDSHPPVVYPAAILRDSRNPDAAAFAAYLRSTTAYEIFRWNGFTVLN
jgi:molybdate transport system substrate-binding protein